MASPRDAGVAAFTTGARSRRSLAPQRHVEQVARLLRRARPSLSRHGPSSRPINYGSAWRIRGPSEYGPLRSAEQSPSAFLERRAPGRGRAAAAAVLESRRAQERADTLAGRA